MAWFNVIKQPAATWTSLNPILQSDEIGVESSLINGVEIDTLKAKLGDGSTRWASLGYWNPAGGSGTGDVVGPASSTDNAIARFDSTTGKLLQNATITVSDTGTIAAASGTLTLTTPDIGVATTTSVNKVTITAPATSATLTIADGKTATVSNSITLAGTDSTTMTFPPASANIGYLESPINSQANDYTGVLADSGKTILITGATKTFTIPANASVAYAVGTCLSGIFTNATGGSVAITSDTMTLAGTTSTGTRTIAQNGRWTAQKMTSTTWLISGVSIS